MNRRLAGPDHSLNAPLRADGESEWQDWLVDESETQETRLAEAEELATAAACCAQAMHVLNERERHILTERRLKDEPTTLEDLSSNTASAASGCARSRCAPSKSCKRR